MKLQDKKQSIMNDIAKNMDVFYEQADIKLRKRIELLNSDSDYEELVSDVTFSILDKLDDPKYVEKFYYMVEHNKLRLYILKSIDTNCTSFTAPFLQGKIKGKRLVSIDNIDYPELVDNGCELEEYTELSENQTMLVKAIYRMMEPENAVNLFGTQWKYFVNLMNEYISNNSTTYKSLGLKYDVPVSSIGSHLQQMKTIIKQNIGNYIINV